MSGRVARAPRDAGPVARPIDGSGQRAPRGPGGCARSSQSDARRWARLRRSRKDGARRRRISELRLARARAEVRLRDAVRLVVAHTPGARVRGQCPVPVKLVPRNRSRADRGPTLLAGLRSAHRAAGRLDVSAFISRRGSKMLRLGRGPRGGIKTKRGARGGAHGPSRCPAMSSLLVLMPPRLGPNPDGNRTFLPIV